MTLFDAIFILVTGAIGTLMGWVVSAKFQKNKIIGAERTAASIVERAKRSVSFAK